MEYVVDFVQMQRFTDQLQVEVLEAMRKHGGKAISEESWQAIVKTRLDKREGQDAASDGASQVDAFLFRGFLGLWAHDVGACSLGAFTGNFAG